MWAHRTSSDVRQSAMQAFVSFSTPRHFDVWRLTIGWREQSRGILLNVVTMKRSNSVQPITGTIVLLTYGSYSTKNLHDNIRSCNSAEAFASIDAQLTTKQKFGAPIVSQLRVRFISELLRPSRSGVLPAFGHLRFLGALTDKKELGMLGYKFSETKLHLKFCRLLQRNCYVW